MNARTLPQVRAFLRPARPVVSPQTWRFTSARRPRIIPAPFTRQGGERMTQAARTDRWFLIGITRLLVAAWLFEVACQIVYHVTME